MPACMDRTTWNTLRVSPQGPIYNLVTNSKMSRNMLYMCSFIKCISPFMLLLIRNQCWCSSVGTNWTKRISLASPTPSWSFTGATRTAREFSSPSFPLHSFSLSSSPLSWLVKSFLASKWNWFHWFAPNQKRCCLLARVCEWHVELEALNKCIAMVSSHRFYGCVHMGVCKCSIQFCLFSSAVCVR